MRTASILSISLLASLAWGQQQPAGGSTPPSSQQNTPSHDMSNMKGMSMGTDKEKDNNSDPGMNVMHSMEGRMDMGPHMKMTALRPSQPGDAERAQQVVDAARKVSSKYIDYHAALAAGFTIFHPEIPQEIYHFMNYEYGMEARSSLNLEHPTALLYEKHGDDYKLVGVMYTAPRSFDQDQLNQRIPLSIAQWHEHVNFCAPPAGRGKEMLAPDPQFGLKGSITTQEACDAAGGTFRPVIFNWMVHVYPFEKDQASIWSTERQRGDTD